MYHLSDPQLLKGGPARFILLSFYIILLIAVNDETKRSGEGAFASVTTASSHDRFLGSAAGCVQGLWDTLVVTRGMLCRPGKVNGSPLAGFANGMCLYDEWEGGSVWREPVLLLSIESLLEGGGMRTTRKVSVWPVGLVGGRRYERPVVENGKVVGWYTGWRADRPFAIDMAGFAVSLQVILSHPKAVFKRRGSQPGMQESDFLKQITTVEELEPKANNCTKVLVWHTRTEKVNLANEPKYHLDTVTIEV
ncbi:PREDICTED: galactosylgalactosylxylosylprotein 3-beta-glucuronosyltransferase 2 [Nestor notabilis]|uniref:galactosylgalactosylxylosylprotein 3-beta-glucuronosyltransferase 2 n=1 Tax=Nestor notabilis TaxID=176057 RepID=UPI000523916F|nr:PREDICTED: galactosylgalactosylxylosylprotein 3-beta-glucuronosyltransferase 2 [Nestor notabilis]